jgi:heat shock protein HslJ
MNRQHLAAVVLALAVGACSTSGSGGKDAGNAPSYDPANAKPPVLTAAANQLVGPVWQWTGTAGADGKLVPVAAPDRYTLTFVEGGRVQVRADCNRGAGGYDVNGGAMSMGPAAMTRVGCPADTQETTFMSQLSRVVGYSIANNQLVLALGDGRAMRFRP